MVDYVLRDKGRWGAVFKQYQVGQFACLDGTSLQPQSTGGSCGQEGENVLPPHVAAARDRGMQQEGGAHVDEGVESSDESVVTQSDVHSALEHSCNRCRTGANLHVGDGVVGDADLSFRQDLYLLLCAVNTL